MKKSFVFVLILLCSYARAESLGTISGNITDDQGIALGSAKVQILSADGAKLIQESTSTVTGDFSMGSLPLGDYQLNVQSPGFANYQAPTHLTTAGVLQINVQLQTLSSGKEMVLNVKATRRLIKTNSSASSVEMTHEQIETLPEGNDISLPRLLETTTPGVVQGSFNQTFIRGNHGNIQYLIDGVQLPDSVSGEFADAFSPRNIDHFEVITGGIPAEYGERLAAVVNIATKAGPEIPGGSAELNYGSYNTFSPQALFGGSTNGGDLHYFFSGSYSRTDRGLDTPQPKSTALGDQGQGGEDAIHDISVSNNQFLKLDWLPNNEDKFSFIAFHNHASYQIPNYPSSFSSSDAYFGATTSYTDAMGNQNIPGSQSLFNYAPTGTDDNQSNEDAYAQFVWKHTFNEHSFLQLAPYWKYSRIQVTADPTNDLAIGDTTSPYYIANATPSSFAMNRHVNNLGLKTDYSIRANDWNLIKAGFQTQISEANDNFFVQSEQNSVIKPFAGGGADTGYLEAIYLQDELTLTPKLSLNAGLRYSATQFSFAESSGTETASDGQLQPRVGLSYLATDQTKLHLFYGRLYMPAPLENLREAFNAFSTTPVAFYDIYAEKDNYFEFGIDQQAKDQLVTMNVYYKLATNMLDDTQLLNTAISSPYNFGDGYAYGLELSFKGRLSGTFTDFLNYSYEIAKGENITGGTFAQPVTALPANTYLYLDHVQVHTANAGITYSDAGYFGTVQGLFGSGLRTGPNNTLSLPSHLTFDLTAGYSFTSKDWIGRWKVSGDILNLLDNPYPITIANGFNGSHYAAGREFFFRLTKEL